MTHKTNRGGEGRNKTPRSPERGSPDLPKSGRAAQQGIARTERGEEQPTDKERAQQVHEGEQKGEQAQRDAAEQQALWPGEPAGHE